MRIPSEFDNDNLYRHRGQRSGTVGTMRRVLRMSVVLVLVVVVMNTASNEAIYQPFFSETIDAPSEERANQPVHGSKTHRDASQYWFFPNLPDSQSQGPKDRLSQEQKSLIESIVDALPRQDRLEWSMAINRFAVGHWQSPMPSSLEWIDREIDDHEEASLADKQGLRQSLDQLNEFRSQQIRQADRDSENQQELSREELPGTELSLTNQRWLMGFYDHLFAKAIQQSEDGAVWRSGDRDALRLLLEQSKWDAIRSVPSIRRRVNHVGVIPLLQQPEVYLGRRVRMQGSVARVERVQPKNNEELADDTTKMPSYYQIWLRPRAGADRPLVALVDRVPESIEKLQQNELIKEGPQVVIVGTFLKRLAYRSGKGADLAPVVVGVLVSTETSRPDVTTAAEPKEASNGSVITSGRAKISIIIAAVLLGLLVSVIIMWRTRMAALQTRRVRRAKQSDTLSFKEDAVKGGLVLCCLLAWSSNGLAQSPLQETVSAEAPMPTGLKLVSGFDVERLGRVYPFHLERAVTESAKLLDRLRRVSKETMATQASPLEQRINPEALLVQGDLFSFTATLKKTQTLRVRQEVSQFLEFARVSYSEFELDRPGMQPLRIETVSLPLPRNAKLNDRFSMVGILVSRPKKTPDTLGLVCASMRWFPSSADSPSHAFLSAQGFDIGLMEGLVRRDRKPLSAADSGAFYDLIRIAAEDASAVAPERVSPVDLLRDSTSKVGSLISIPVETVQIIRVAVSESLRQKQLGQDHYFQIDAMGELEGAVRIEIPKSKENPDGDQVLFENRYPVSIVTKQLPSFLLGEAGEPATDQAILRDVRVRMQVTGYFFRLWSYSTERMDSYGDKQQFGPLVIGADFDNLEREGTDPIGVRRIGWVAAGLFVISLVAIFLWHRWTSVADARIRKQRSEKEITPFE